MGKISYKIQKAGLDALKLKDSIKAEDKQLIDSYKVNTAFIPKQHTVELSAFAADGTLLDYVDDYTQYRNDSTLGNRDNESLSSLELNPASDSIFLGYPNGDVYLTYNFINNLLVEGKFGGDLYIEKISSDRTELRALARKGLIEGLKDRVDSIATKLESNSYFSDFFLNFGDNKLVTGINIKAEDYRGQTAVILKLYEPLPREYVDKTTFTLVEKVSDTVIFEVEATEEQDFEPVPNLKGPNFNIEVVDENHNPTEYLTYNELFSYPVQNSYYELNSLFNEKSAQISIDHNDLSSFIHFSSAEERLHNFKYKIDLIKSYNEAIDTINNTGYTLEGTAGSITKYEDLITGITKNFDHYERFLYFENSPNAWPKSNNNRPYTLDYSSTADLWYAQQVNRANTFDNTNYDALTNTVPEFIREDSSNNPMIMFVHMIAQHFDNIWIYLKSTSDKYDADNRLDAGISKDLVREALESFGVKLYNSNLNLGELFSMFTGEEYNPGNEIINNYKVVTSGTQIAHLQPMPIDNYQKEVYKRIYHNLPLLTKSKGTERGLRALINCFGIPSEMLSIKTFGGQNSDQGPFYGPLYSSDSTLDKIRLDATGSIVPGNTLSALTSINKLDDKYSVDVHTIEVGVSATDNINKYIEDTLLTSFDIDEYIGDPREAYSNRYGKLEDISKEVLGDLGTYGMRDFVRLIKFFDNSIFRIVRDFIPARSNINSGIIIKPHLLDRSKAKQVEVTWTQPEYSASIDMTDISASHGDSFGIEDNYVTAYTETVIIPDGTAIKEYHNHEETKYDGEFSGSYIEVTDGELNRSNTIKRDEPPQIKYNLFAIDDSQPVPEFCDVVFTATTQGTSTPTPIPPIPVPVEPVPTPLGVIPATSTPITQTPINQVPIPTVPVPTVNSCETWIVTCPSNASSNSCSFSWTCCDGSSQSTILPNDTDEYICIQAGTNINYSSGTASKIQDGGCTGCFD